MNWLSDHIVVATIVSLGMVIAATVLIHRHLSRVEHPLKPAYLACRSA